MTSYQIHHLNFLKIAYNNLIKCEPFTNEDISQDDEAFILSLKNLIEAFETGNEEAYSIGEEVLERAFRMYPGLAHLIARDLLWFFGGSCLHNMADEEIEKFQRLDELRFKAEENNEEFDYLNTRASVFGQN